MSCQPAANAAGLHRGPCASVFRRLGPRDCAGPPGYKASAPDTTSMISRVIVA